ncbi:MAG: two-component regulator propeller domain-containing protein [Acidobacteriota bacterium]
MPVETASSIDHLTVRDGLSQVTIRDLHQDRRGFLWIATGDGLNRYDGDEFKIYRHRQGDLTSMPGNEVMVIFEDRDGVLWFGTRTSGLAKLDRSLDRFEIFRHDPVDPDSLGDDRIVALAQADDGSLWIGTHKGLTTLDPQTGQTARYRREPHIRVDDWITGIGTDSNGSVWVASSRGLFRVNPTGMVEAFDESPWFDGKTHPRQFFAGRAGTLWITGWPGLTRYDPASGTFDVFRNDPSDPASLPDDRVVDVAEADDGTLWVATTGGGLARRDPRTGRFSTLRHRANDPNSLSSDSLLSMTLDREGIVWAGSYVGLNKIDPRRAQFQTYRHIPGNADSLASNSVWPIWEDRRGSLWVGTYDRGLHRIDRDEGRVTRYRNEPADPSSLPHGTVESLYEDRQGRFWVGTREGLSRMDRETGAFFDPWHDDEASPRFPRSEVFCMTEDSAGRFWVGTIGLGLVHFDREREQPVRFFTSDPSDERSLTESRIYDVLEAEDGRLWVGTLNGGLNRLDPDSGRVERFRHDPDDPRSLNGNRAVLLHRDRRGQLWVGTQRAGLHRYLGEGRGFEVFTADHGLPGGSVLGILEDDAGHLWLSTFNGLSRFDPANETFVNFSAEDGLQGDSFSPTSYFRSATGEMFFGGTQGLNAFFPDAVAPDATVPKVVLTEMRLFDEEVEPGSTPVLPRSLETLDEMVLSHEDYVFSLRFTALQFRNPEKIRFSYQLEPFDPQWIDVGANERIARYSNLAPGRYTFRVRAGSAHEVWSEPVELGIVQRSAPWLTWWAWSFYSFVALVVVAAFVRRQTRRVAEQQAINARLREVDTLKNELLANTSHELRTPLFAMTGITESLIDGKAGPLSEEVRVDLQTVASSGYRLARLLDDLLDYSKLRSTRFQLHLAPVSLHALADVVLTLIEPLVDATEVELVNDVAPDLAPVHADEHRLHQILLNLVGNAAKFTETGQIRLSARPHGDDGDLVIVVHDTGIGISAEDRHSIFAPFAQADASTKRSYGGAGLGLAICRQLVELHGGRLWVESEPGSGSRFHFTLPTTEGAARPVAPTLKARTLADVVLPQLPSRPCDGRAGDFQILIVDDEEIVRQVLCVYLQGEDYRYQIAADGEQALRILEEESIDLVLLDVMMPRMSGYEVCRAIRETRSLEDLPVIFLSAMTDATDIAAGLAEGANDYLAKPVGQRELVMRLDTHLRVLAAHRARQDEVKVLRGLLPICSGCKKIRDEDGAWELLESYIDRHSEARFTHSLCPDCVTSVLVDS